MKTRRKFTRDLKISVLRELEAGKSVAEVCRGQGIHPSLLGRWKREYKENPETAFKGNGKACKPDAKAAEYERLIGRLYAENAFLKKALSTLETSLMEYQKRN